MAGMATKRPVTVAMSAPATPGAMAVRLAALALAMPEKVSITPQTVPSKPMKGPPATAVERMIMPFSSERAWALAARSRATRTESKEAVLILVVIWRARWSVSAPVAVGSLVTLVTVVIRIGLFLRW